MFGPFDGDYSDADKGQGIKSDLGGIGAPFRQQQFKVSDINFKDLTYKSRDGGGEPSYRRPSIPT